MMTIMTITPKVPEVMTGSLTSCTLGSIKVGPDAGEDQVRFTTWDHAQPDGQAVEAALHHSQRTDLFTNDRRQRQQARQSPITPAWRKRAIYSDPHE
jgi:hypothetical protein